MLAFYEIIYSLLINIVNVQFSWTMDPPFSINQQTISAYINVSMMYTFNFSNDKTENQDFRKLCSHFCFLETVDFWKSTMELFLTFNVRCFVSPDDLYIYMDVYCLKRTIIADNHVDFFISSGW